MTSSSAYSNVLNTSPVAPRPNSVPKRDLSSEASGDDFHQTLQNARAEHDRNTKADSVKTAKNAAPKKVQSRDDNSRSDNQKQPANTDHTHSSKTADAKSSDVKKTSSAKKADADEKTTDEQTVTTQDANAKPVDAKTDCENALLNPGLNLLAANTSDTVENADEQNALVGDAKPISVDTSAKALTSSVAADKTSGGVSTNEASTDGVSIDKVSTDKVSTDKVTTDAILAGAGVATDEATQSDGKITQSDAKKSESNADGDDALLVNANPAGIGLTTQTSGVVANANPAADAQAALAAVAANSTKSASGTQPLTTEATTTLAVDDQLETSGDTKSGFEKMLQAMVANNTNQQSQDSNSQSSSTQSGNTNTTPAGVIESLARTIDSQTPAARSFVVQTSVPVPVGQPQWSQAVGEKVLWLAAQNVSSAEIRLDPPDLGPMQVKVSVNQDQTNVSFTSHHPIVREVLDQNLHRLRDMFAEQGLNLGSVDVSDKSFSRQQGEGKGQSGSGNNAETINEEETPVAVSTIVQQRLVDHYA